jgi:hypothetical protein
MGSLTHLKKNYGYLAALMKIYWRIFFCLEMLLFWSFHALLINHFDFVLLQGGGPCCC